VEAITVELHGQPLLRPAAVDTTAAGWTVGDREWEALVAQQLQETGFEGAERHVDVSVDDSAELPGAGVGRPPRQDGLDGSRRCLVADSGLVARARECIDG